MLRPRQFRVAAILLLVVFLQMAAPPLSAQDGEVPLEATLVSFSKATGEIEFDVYSHSETPVVAWHIKIVVRESNGDEHFSIIGSDYWPAGSNGFLEDGGSRRGRHGMSRIVEYAELGEPPIELIVVSAVFADGRSAGEPESVENTFLFRAGALSECCRLAAVFDAASREVHSSDALRDSLEIAIDRSADAPISPKPKSATRSETLEHRQKLQSSDRFRAGVLIQRKDAAEFLGALNESLDSVPSNKIDKTITQLRREAATYHKYCSEASIHLRQPYLDLVQPDTPSPDQRSQP